MVGVSNIENTKNFLGICVQDRGAILKINAWATISIFNPLFKLTDSGMKRGEMEEIMVSCFFLTSLV